MAFLKGLLGILFVIFPGFLFVYFSKLGVPMGGCAVWLEVLVDLFRICAVWAVWLICLRFV